MKLLKIALVAAFPVEAINSWLALRYPIDVGLPPETAIWVKIVFAQALYLHFPAFPLLDWVDAHRFPLAVFYVGLLLIGYIDTVLLIFAVLFGVRGIRLALFNAAQTPRTSY